MGIGRFCLRPPPTLTPAAAAALEAPLVARGEATTRDGGAFVTLAHAMAWGPRSTNHNPAFHASYSCALRQLASARGRDDKY